MMNDTLKEYIPRKPSITYRHLQNLKDMSMKSQHMSNHPKTSVGSRSPKWGCRLCGSWNMESTTIFWDTRKIKE